MASTRVQIASRSPKEWLGFLPVTAVYAVLVVRFWWLCDDAYISFRYGLNWASGHGLRFNPGEDPPVEGYSNFLWTAWCALLEGCGLEPQVWAPATSFAAGVFLLIAFWRSLRHDLEISALPALLATSILVCCPPFFVWSTGGLETLPFALILFLLFREVALRPGGARLSVATVCALIVSLLRIDGFAWAILAGVLGWAMERSRQSTSATPRQTVQRFALVYFAVLSGGLATYFLIRWAYFGAVVPNTVYAKASFTWPLLMRGGRYVASFFATFIGPVAFLPAAVLALRPSSRPVGPAAVTMALAGLGYAVLSGGDFMAMFRFLVAGFTVYYALLLALLLDDLQRRGWTVPMCATALLVIALSLTPVLDLHLVPESVRRSLHYRSTFPFRSELQFWKHMQANTRNWAAFGQLLKERYPSGGTCVVGFVGAIGYHSDLYILDPFGLVTPEIARRPIEGPLYAPGHDKHVSFEYFLDRQPDVLYLVQEPQSLEGLVSWATRFERFTYADRYVPDFSRLTMSLHSSEEAGFRYMVFARRIPDGATRQHAWGVLAQRITQLRQVDGAPPDS